MARQRLPAEQRREQILEEAVKLFSRNGFDRTTVREIARAAGINEATIYKHFETKEALFDAIIEGFIEFGSQLMGHTAPREIGPLPETISAVARGLLGHLTRDTTLPRLMLYSALQGHSLSERFYKEITSAILKQIEEKLRRGQLEGIYRSAVDPFIAARAFLGNLIIFIFSQQILGAKRWEPINVDEYARQTVDIFLHGICTEREGDK